MSSTKAAGTEAVVTSNTAKGTRGYPPGVDLNLIARGYKVALRNGEYVYCRKDAITGTRFTQRVCLTAYDIADLEVRAKEAIRAHDNGVCKGDLARCSMGGP